MGESGDAIIVVHCLYMLFVSGVNAPHGVLHVSVGSPGIVIHRCRFYCFCQFFVVLVLKCFLSCFVYEMLTLECDRGKNWIRRFRRIYMVFLWGGGGGAPKKKMPTNLRFCLL
jgi:hypothetical protein